jgi:hypothetical protein
VNGHLRAYDVPSLMARIPSDWSLTGIVLTGESWMQSPPVLTDWKIATSGQWNSWSEASCPVCGRNEPRHPRPVDAPLAADHLVLGETVYRDVEVQGPHSRNHTELLVLLSSNEAASQRWAQAVNRKVRSQSLLSASVEYRGANVCVAPSELDRLDNLLLPFPQVARCLRTTDGALTIQAPVYGTVEALVCSSDASADVDPPVVLTVEDGEGTLVSTEVDLMRGGECAIQLPRPARPGPFGVLLKFNRDVAGLRVTVGTRGPPVLVANSGAQPITYHPHLDRSGAMLWLQVAGETWFGEDQLNSQLPHETLSPEQMKALVGFTSDASVFVRTRARASNVNADSACVCSVDV